MMEREPSGSLAAEDRRNAAWYARTEVPGPWRVPACREHGRILEEHRFERMAPAAAPPARAAESCAICRSPALLEEVERCTCEDDPARCPAHQNVGCGG